eukprot:TRINITY_DN34867_c0_g1_i1.p1 TRINITY_DN34867_c0_g1~~TRINITY_DN34867_c0_g1_i1.p1  ORF type:complete len:1311 (-),score=224.56 TRINITY_DN34867_c0_g1_i1:43-3975(-)
MEVLAALGFGAKELFSYNRENFKFDQDQRIERETFRLDMQVKRFELFREDVRDLVELTVDRMDVYHLVGALFLEFCIVLFCEGRVQASAPPFLLSMFLLSNACAFIYLLLAVWLSMHASIAAHSFGVRLLTRFVRLPIPSLKQLNMLRSHLKDYEHQSIGNLLRLPFVDTTKQEWDQSLHVGDKGASSSGAAGAALPSLPGTGSFPAHQAARSPSPSPERPGPPRRQSTSYLKVPQGSPLERTPEQGSSAHSGMSATPPRVLTPGREVVGGSSSSSARPPTAALEEQHLLPAEMESPFGGADLLRAKKGALPERHVQLFRQLQAKWQCYDAYCRVCMGLGVNQILQGLSYYAICHTLVENHSPTTGYALVFLFQSTTIALAVLDLAGLKRREILAIQIVGVMPCLFTAFGVAHGDRDDEGKLNPEEHYKLSPLSFLFQVLWLELWLRVAAPSEDHAKLPRRFRQVLFLDVFGDAQGWEPSQAEDDSQEPDLLDQMLERPFDAGGASADEEEDFDARQGSSEVQRYAELAASQLTVAQCAVRRWKSVPSWALSGEQAKELDRLREQLSSWGQTISNEFQRGGGVLRGQTGGIFEAHLRNWGELSVDEKASDPFATCLLGPFQHDAGYSTSHYHYNLETQATLFEDQYQRECPGALVLTLDAVAAILRDLEKDARLLLESRITYDLRAETRRRKVVAKAKASQGLRQRLGGRPAAAQLGDGSPGIDKRRRMRRGRSRGSDVLDTAPRPTLREVRKNPVRAASGFFPNLVKLFDKKNPYGKLSDDHHLTPSLLPDRQDSIELTPASSAMRIGAGASSDSLRRQDRSFSAGSEADSQSVASEVFSNVEGLGLLPDDDSVRSLRPSEKDPTLLAMAGEHARHFVPERLPWQVLSRMTRVLQICWFYAGVMALLKEMHIYQVDFQEHPASERRRLGAAVNDVLFTEPWKVEWPHGSLFRPQALTCLPGQLLMGSPHAVYQPMGGLSSMATWFPMARDTLTSASPPLRLQELERLGLSPTASLICDLRATAREGARRWTGLRETRHSAPSGGDPVFSASSSSASSVSSSLFDMHSEFNASYSKVLPRCLWSSLTPDGLRLSRFGVTADASGESSASLRLAGAPWKVSAGAIVNCMDYHGLLPPRSPLSRTCMLLAGWDGAMLPVALIPLPDGADGEGTESPLEFRLPEDGSALRPAFDVPLQEGDVERGLLALHLEPQSGRLWALIRGVVGAELEGWDLHRFRSLGRRKVRWPVGVGARFSPAAFCEAEGPEGLGLLAVGRTSTRSRPVLLHASLPSVAEMESIMDNVYGSGFLGLW